jgi:hypothetical protein
MRRAGGSGSGTSGDREEFMILDYVIANRTGTLIYSFVAERDPDTLKSLGGAPIFDNGSSLRRIVRDAIILQHVEYVSSMPFLGTRAE